ncbi:hypothetical protein [Yinghuangia sp. YIM S09857]|uniref:hypothetical protein n=1 Tax=Yinghuangia sp. YIM S09857 TaxID=3436929 RepID=UPI003F538131
MFTPIARRRGLPRAYHDFPETPIEVSGQSVQRICRQYGLNLADTMNVIDAYRTLAADYAPFNTWLAASILRDLREAVRLDPDVHIVFLGRDGHALAAGCRGLDPAFVARHTTEARLSRPVMKALLRQHERREARTAGRPAPRTAANKRDEGTSRTRFVRSEVARMFRERGQLRNTRAYFRRLGLPVDDPDARVIVVDNGLLGSTSEAMHKAFAWDVQSHLALAMVTPDHPRPNRIKGHLVHVPPERPIGTGILPYVPNDPKLALLSNQVITLWESITQGPRQSVARVSVRGPVDERFRKMAPKFHLTPPRWKNPQAVRAMRTAALLLAYRHAAGYRDRDLDGVLVELNEARDRFPREVRRVAAGDPTVDRSLADLSWAGSWRWQFGGEADYKAGKLAKSRAVGLAPPERQPSALDPAPGRAPLPGIAAYDSVGAATGDTCAWCLPSADPAFAPRTTARSDARHPRLEAAPPGRNTPPVHVDPAYDAVADVLRRSLGPVQDSAAVPNRGHQIAPPVKTGVYPDMHVTLGRGRHLAKGLQWGL